MKRKNEKGQSEVIIGTAGQIDHGKTSLIEAITGIWTARHSEELKRGITIKLGYAVANVYYCKSSNSYTTQPLFCKDPEFRRKISFLDVPGHEALMTTMISGAALIDGALLVIAANEPCPQPQTEEHLKVLEILGIKNIVIAQNKIDLVSKEKAIENYNQILKFIEGTVAEGAPIIPVSAYARVNIDILIEAIEKFIPTPERDLSKDPIFLIARSFDVNKPGTSIDRFVGGVVGGALIQGKLKVGDEVEIVPGKVENKEYEPIITEIVSINTGDGFIDEVVPGGTVGIGTDLDPVLTKQDKLVGNVMGLVGKTPEPTWELTIDAHLFEKVVGSEKKEKVEKIKEGEYLVINAWTARTLSYVDDVKGDTIHLLLKDPICILPGHKITLSRNIEGRWRLIGWGVVK